MKRLALLLSLVLATNAAAQVSDSALSEGMALVQQGDFEGAVLKLDEATRALAGDPTRTRALADAYLFLGISYVELNQELNARAKFREVLKKEPQRYLSERVYSQQVIRVFEAARQELYPKKKKKFLPLLLIAGGGTAAAGTAIAVASGGETTTTTSTSTTSTTLGGGGGATRTPTPTTVVTDPGNPTSTPTPTATTLPGTTPTATPVGTATATPVGTATATPVGTATATPTGPTATPTQTPVGPTATPTATPVGPTATPTATDIPPTATPTRTPTPSCTYTMSPPSVNILLLGGNGTCTVTTNMPSCPWTAQRSDTWIQFNGQTSGPGNGSIPWSAGLTLAARTGEITLSGTQGSTNARCQIVQGGLVPPPDEKTTPQGAFAMSRFDVQGARGQITVNGATAHFQTTGEAAILSATNAGANRVVAQIVTAVGRPGTWRFEVGVPLVAGSLRAEAGDAVAIGERTIEFRLAGRAGERVVFSFLAP